MLLVVHLIMIVVLILLGILFYFGKGADLIAGYNTLPAEKKAEYDVKKLCKYMSKLMFALAVCIKRAFQNNGFAVDWAMLVYARCFVRCDLYEYGKPI